MKPLNDFSNNMEVVDVRLLVMAVSADLMKKLQEVVKYKRPNLVEYCSKTRSLLKRVKKIVTWCKNYSIVLKKEKELTEWLDERKAVQKSIAQLFFELKTQQSISLRTAPFAIAEASDVLCRQEYFGFPVLQTFDKKEKVPVSKLNRLMKHKCLSLDLPLGASIRIEEGLLKVRREEFYFKFTLTPEFEWELLKPNYLRKFIYQPELKWKFIKPFRLRSQELTPAQVTSK
jgi:hypothetical protein